MNEYERAERDRGRAEQEAYARGHLGVRESQIDNSGLMLPLIGIAFFISFVIYLHEQLVAFYAKYNLTENQNLIAVIATYASLLLALFLLVKFLKSSAGRFLLNFFQNALLIALLTLVTYGLIIFSVRIIEPYYAYALSGIVGLGVVFSKKKYKKIFVAIPIYILIDDLTFDFLTTIVSWLP
jgi:hypothetical protein